MKWLTECNPVDAAKLSGLLKAAREFTRWDWTHLLEKDDEGNDLCLLKDLSALKEAVKALTVDAETPEGFCPFCEVETAGEAHSLVNCIDWLREKRFAAEYDKHVAEGELARLRGVALMRCLGCRVEEALR